MLAVLKWLVGACVIATLAWLGWHLWLKPRMMVDKGYLELAQAPVWADLQGIELQHRSAKNLQVPMLLKGAVDSGKYDVLGLAGTSQRNPYVWIVLNADAGVNGIYAMPANERFSLPCSYLKTLETSEQINSKVHVVLAAHCARAEPMSARTTST